jgi:signal transduction histidine kinase/CheY-like chemotaxis protein
MIPLSYTTWLDNAIFGQIQDINKKENVKHHCVINIFLFPPFAYMMLFSHPATACCFMLLVFLSMGLKIWTIKKGNYKIYTILSLVELLIAFEVIFHNVSPTIRCTGIAAIISSALSLSSLHNKFHIGILIVFVVSGIPLFTAMFSRTLLSTIFQLIKIQGDFLNKEKYTDFYLFILCQCCFYFIHKFPLEKTREENIILRLENQSTMQRLKELQNQAREGEILVGSLGKQIGDLIKEKEVIIDSISHEFRNPLNSLLGAIDLLHSDIFHKKHRELIEIAQSCGSVLSRLLNNLIDAENMKLKTLNVSPSPSNMYDFSDSIWKQMIVKCSTKKLQCAFYLSKKLPKDLMLDVEKLYQILDNLIDNAIKFADKGWIGIFISWYDDKQSIDDAIRTPNPVYVKHCKEAKLSKIECFATDHQIPHIKCSPKLMKSLLTDQYFIFKNQEPMGSIRKVFNRKLLITEPRRLNQQGVLKIEVVDTGCGISSEFQNDMWRAFKQHDNSINRKNGGMGLGLHIVHELVHLMKGEIICHSTKDVGSDFMCLIPVTVCAPTSMDTSLVIPSLIISRSAVQTVDCPAQHALVIEDNACNQLIMKTYFDKLGLITTVANNGKEGFEAYIAKGENYFSLITLDLQMPEVDGITCGKMIRQYEKEHHWRKPIPIVIVSGNSSEEEKTECINAKGIIQAVHFYRKPLSYQDCQKFVEQILTQQITNLKTASSSILIK